MSDAQQSASRSFPGALNDLADDLQPRPKGQAAPNLPCAVLVVDANLRAAAQVAARLMEQGYTCRVTKPEEAQTALSEQRFEVVVLEVSPQEARLDQGRASTQPFLSADSFSGVVLLTSAAPLQRADVRSLTKPYLIAQLVQSIESARQASAPAQSPPEAPRPPRSQSLPSPTAPGVAPPNHRAADPSAAPRPASARSASVRSASAIPNLPPNARGLSFIPKQSSDLLDAIAPPVQTTRFDKHALGINFSGGAEGVTGRALSLDSQSQLTLECALPNNISQEILVTFTPPDRPLFVVPGTLQSPEGGQLPVALRPDKEHRVMLQRFAEAASNSERPLEPLKIRFRGDSLNSIPVPDDVSLARLWDEVCNQMGDDAAQQRFIQACMKVKKLEYAVSCYRDLKEDRPEDDRIDKYLQQVGTILSFYALKKQDTQGEEGLSRGLKVVLGLFLLAAGCLMLLIAFRGG